MLELNEKALSILSVEDTQTYSKKIALVKQMVEDMPTKTIIEAYVEIVKDFTRLAKQYDARQMRSSAGGLRIPISQEQFEQHFRIIGTDGRGRKVGSKNKKDAE